jgi:hypothetical protein
VLFRTYERLIVEASLDVAFASRLLANPQCAAIDAGYDRMVAESLVGLRAGSLDEFADALRRRVYGRPSHGSPMSAGAGELSSEPMRLVSA